MKFRHQFARLYRRPEPGEDGMGDTSTATTEPIEPADTTPEPSATTGTGSDTPQPKTMLEAMFPKDKPAADPAAADATKPPGTPDAAKEGDKPADPNKPEDVTAMPEGLSPKAQERFQKLANVNKDLTSNVQRQSAQLEYFSNAFKENGTSQPQFEQAMGVIGMINRGDLEGALQVLDQQREQIALHLGKPLPGVDPLKEFPDLRERVDSMLMTEQHALEVARSRASERATNQQRQTQQNQRDSAQAQERAWNAGQAEVDKYCKEMASKDLDYAAIEAKLLPRIQNGLLEGIPPQRWAAVVKQTYELIKETAGQFKGNGGNAGAPGAGNTLRPGGGGDTPKAKPQNMFDAMWNR